MTDQFSDELFLTPGIDKTANEDPNIQYVSLDPYAGTHHADAVVSPTMTAGIGPVNEVPAEVFPKIEPVPYMAPEDDILIEATGLSETIPYQAPTPEAADLQAPVNLELLDQNETEHFRTRWSEIQGKFVDEPRDAVKQADQLVSDVIEKIALMFAAEHTTLDGQWNQGNEVDTEDLRKILQRYRAFFNRLVV